MNKPSDHSARAQAQDIQRSFIVQAPAGSGKTELLTMRMLRLLAVVEQPEEVLCITFTNKAAAEMKERILSSIEPAFTEQTYPEDHKNEKAALGKQVYQRSAELGWNLLQNPGRLAVRTIDSFNHFLIRQMPVSSGLGGAVEIAEEPAELYQQAVRNLLEIADENIQSSLKYLLQHLDNRYDRLEQRLIEMLAIRDQWLPMVLEENPTEMLEHIERNIEDLVESELKSTIPYFKSATPMEFFELASFAAENLIEAGSESTITLLAGLTRSPDPFIDQLDIWKAIAELLLTASGSVRKTVTKAQGFPAGKANAEQKKGFLSCLQTVAADDTLAEQLIVIKKLPLPSYPDSQKELLLHLFTLLKTLYASLKIVFDEQNYCDHGEISLAALHSLGSDEQPTDLALSLDYRFQHILIDEFQDTSNLQVQLLEKLTQGWLPDDGRSLFLVGDPMQSIYKFRQADVGIYLSIQQNGVGDIQLEPLRLTANFRSQGSLINWVNSQFGQIFGDTNNWLHGEIAYSSSTASRDALHAPAIAVESFLFIDPPNREAQAKQLVELIRKSRQLEPTGSIAILVRARSHLLAVVEQLKNEDIDFQATDIDPLAELPYIRDLQTLTRALCHPADRIAWLALLRSPACGLTLESLLLISSAGDDTAQSTIWQQIQNSELLEKLPADERQRIERFNIPLKRSLDNIGRKSFRILLEGCWLELGGMLLAEDQSGIENTQRFFALIEKLSEAGHPPDISVLEKRIEKLYAQSQKVAPDAVQIMTIHKAKGLEFSTVILPSLERKPAADKDKLLNWHLYRNDQNCNELLLAPIRSENDKSPDSISNYLKYIDKIRAENELKRVLYVAATRAKNRLFLLGDIKSKPDNDKADTEFETLAESFLSPAKNSLLSFMWPDYANDAELIECQEGESASVEEKEAETQNPLARFPANWQDNIRFPLNDSPNEIDQSQYSDALASPVPDILDTNLDVSLSVGSNELPEPEVNSVSAAIGTLVHRSLAQITQDGVDSWSTERITKQLPIWRNQLLQLGIYEELEAALATIQKQVALSCESEHGKWILDGSHLDSQTEWPITVRANGAHNAKYMEYRVDRTFVDDKGIRWVIDYKSSQPTVQESQHPTGSDETSSGQTLEQFLRYQKNQYKKQMQTYYDAFQKLEDRPIKLALYYPAIDHFQIL